MPHIASLRKDRRSSAACQHEFSRCCCVRMGCRHPNGRHCVFKPRTSTIHIAPVSLASVLLPSGLRQKQCPLLCDRASNAQAAVVFLGWRLSAHRHLLTSPLTHPSLPCLPLTCLMRVESKRLSYRIQWVAVCNYDPLKTHDLPFAALVGCALCSNG